MEKGEWNEERGKDRRKSKEKSDVYEGKTK